MLKKKRHETLPLVLTVQGQGDKIKFKVEYRNLTSKQIEELSAGEGTTMGQLLVGLIQSWECEYELTIDGLTELEDDRPGMIEALMTGFNEARRMNKVKN